MGYSIVGSGALTRRARVLISGDTMGSSPAIGKQGVSFIPQRGERFREKLNFSGGWGKASETPACYKECPVFT